MLLLDTTQTASELATVVLMGMGTVFVGLIIIIFMCKILGWIVGSSNKEETPAPVETVSPAQQNAPIQNKGEVVAAISSAVAESLGKDVRAIRIVSIKRV